MSKRVLVATATADALFRRALVEVQRLAPGASVTVLAHWRAAALLPPDVAVVLAGEARGNPASLVRQLRALAPAVTVVVADGAPGATAVKLLGLAAGGRRIVVRSDGSVYRLPHDTGATLRHVLALAPALLDRIARAVGALVGVPVLLAAVWRHRRRA